MKQLFIRMLFVLNAAIGFTACTKENYEFGELVTPRNLQVNVAVQGATTSAPAGDGSGTVTITTSADNALTYRVDYGDGNVEMIPSGTAKHVYTKPGTETYKVTVSAVGTGGTQTVLSKTVNVFVRFALPADILTALTGTGSKVWATDNGSDGHFGVGPADQFAPIWYAATPNSREACAYDDRITFTKDALGNVTMLNDNKGQSFSIGAATAFYGAGGGDACLGVNAGPAKNISFFNSNSGSNAGVSRMISFEIPGNGLLNFGVGSKVYEILSITNTQLHLRTIGIDGNAWYMKLKAI